MLFYYKKKIKQIISVEIKMCNDNKLKLWLELFSNVMMYYPNKIMLMRVATYPVTHL